jgi:hypothetical protein
MWWWRVLATVLVAVPVVSLTPPPGTAATNDAGMAESTTSQTTSDFNGDGVDDWIVGVPWNRTYDARQTGGAHVVYRGPGGVAPAPGHFLGTRTPGIRSQLAQYPSLLGAEIATGDFDRDGYADAAINVPGFDEPEADDQYINVGGVLAVYGSAGGLDPQGAQPARIWSQDSNGVQGVSEDGDSFGASLAVGDFDGDTFHDLVIGAPGERTGPELNNSGSLTVLYGGRYGLTGRDQVVDQDTRGILDASERRDTAAQVLVAGDFNGDGVDDVAMGVSGEDVAGVTDAGAVNVIYGVKGEGLRGAGDQFLHAGLADLFGELHEGDSFGETLAVGDFDGDRVEDLAVATPDDTSTDEVAGRVTVVPGSTSGLDLTESRTLTTRMVERWEPLNFSAFGTALAAGDVDGDGLDELAVGTWGWYGDQGRVDVFRGAADGVTAVGAQSFRPDDFTLDGAVPGETSFGLSLQLGDFDGLGGEDLLIGVDADLDIDGERFQHAGGVLEVFNAGAELTSASYRWHRQGFDEIGDEPGEWDRFGFALAGSSWTP